MKTTALSKLLFHLPFLLSLPLFTHGTPAPTSAGPIVKLDYGSFQGVTEDGGIEKFLGIPFAAPPIGNLRFAPPQPPIKFSGVRQATKYGLACPQQNTGNLSILPSLGLPEDIVIGLGAGPTPATIPASEDCLFINIIKPASIENGKKLPVLFWIYGGAFEVGDSSLNPGDTVVNRSLVLNEHVIHVSVNYRVNAFGFLGGKEAQAAGAGNIGLKDQRFALKWVQKYITLFGGDPEKVTIWGESAGAISVGLHLVMNDGNPERLFRAAVMESGSPLPLKPISAKQNVYDQLVSNAGCGGSRDTFLCLRELPFDTLMAAINKSPILYSAQSLILAYAPTIDGELIVRDPVTSIHKGLYARVPIISGDLDDEGTLFTLSVLNVTTNAEFREYISTVYLPGITEEQLNAVANAYPDDVTKGSPFNTGNANALTPQYKRLAAFQGDVFFQAPRRFFMQATAKTQPTYGFLFIRDKSLPFLGSFHSHDIPEFYGSGDLPDFIGTDALLNFATNLNPNSPKGHSVSLLSSIEWPLYNSSSTAPPLLSFVDPAPSVSITSDTFRFQAMQLLTNITSELGLN